MLIDKTKNSNISSIIIKLLIYIIDMGKRISVSIEFFLEVFQSLLIILYYIII